MCQEGEGSVLSFLKFRNRLAGPLLTGAGREEPKAKPGTKRSTTKRGTRRKQPRGK